MPCYAASGPGGSGILAILSEAFFKWGGNLKDTKRTLSAPSRKDTRAGPKFFYPTASAHLSQSDFGILFPWLTSKVLKADEPERYIKLNARAILQVLRENGYEVADTSKIDLEEGIQEDKQMSVVGAEKGQDWRILDVSGAVRGWVAMDVGGNTEKMGSDASSSSVVEDSRTPSDKVVLETEVLGEMKN